MEMAVQEEDRQVISFLAKNGAKEILIEKPKVKKEPLQEKPKKKEPKIEKKEPSKPVAVREKIKPEDIEKMRNRPEPEVPIDALKPPEESELHKLQVEIDSITSKPVRGLRNNHLSMPNLQP